METLPLKIIKLIVTSIVFFLLFSCNKDSDLLVDYIINDSEIILDEIKVSVIRNKPLFIDPITENSNQVIVSVTEPSIGIAEINDENTIIYTPNENEVGNDNFQYSVETTNSDNTVNISTGNVSVVISENENDKGPSINFSSYGAIGDGKVDDTAALQAAMNAESNLVGTQGATYRISGELIINSNGDQMIDWNSSTIVAKSTVNNAISIKKKEGITTVRNLNVNGNFLLSNAFNITSAFDFKNVHVLNLYSSTTRAVGWRIEVPSIGFKVAKMDSCVADNIESANNNILGDVVGTSRAVWLRWLSVDSSTVVEINNCTFGNIWGDDGDVFQIEQTTNNYTHNCKLIVRNSVLKYSSRRLVKGTAANMEFYNTKFISTSKTNSRLKSSVPSSGMVTLATFNQVAYPDSNSRFIKLIGCTFDNTLGYDGRIIPTRTTDFEISGCTFINSSISFYVRVGSGIICGNSFDQGSFINDYGTGGVSYEGTLGIGTNNTGPTGYNKIGSSKWTSITCN